MTEKSFGKTGRFVGKQGKISGETAKNVKVLLACGASHGCGTTFFTSNAKTDLNCQTASKDIIKIF